MAGSSESDDAKLCAELAQTRMQEVLDGLYGTLPGEPPSYVGDEASELARSHALTPASTVSEMAMLGASRRALEQPEASVASSQLLPPGAV